MQNVEVSFAKLWRGRSTEKVTPTRLNARVGLGGRKVSAKAGP